MPEFETLEMRSVIGKVFEAMPHDELNQMQPTGPATVDSTLATI
ncbi:MAG: hypothetical protein WAO83_07400 [Fuerstiella sp.]